MRVRSRHAREYVVNKRERESHRTSRLRLLLTRPLSDDDAPAERHESRSNAPQLPPILEFSRFRRKRGALIVRARRRHVSHNYSLIFLVRATCFLSSVLVECKQGVRSLRRGRKLRREPHRPFCTRHFYSLTRIHNLPFSFPLPLTFFVLPRPSHPRDSRCRPPRARPCARARLAPHARLFFFLRRKEKRSSPRKQRRTPPCYGSRSWAAFTRYVPARSMPL